jgi:hypothetical protein
VQVAFLGWPPHWLQMAYVVYGWAIIVLAVPLQRSLPADPQRLPLARR